MSLMRALSESVRDDRTLLASILFAGSSVSTLNRTNLWETTDAAMALGPLAPRPALARQWALDVDVDTLDRLQELRLPVHVVWGDEDRLIPANLTRTLINAIPGAFGTRLTACGHVPMVDAPEAFAESVTTFLRRLG
jgi:pimeloyl-ACP methyl ester carboxylesterase